MSRRSIVHPGPVAACRHAAVPCRAVPLTLTLMPGRSINAAIAEAFADAGFEGGFVELVDVPMARMNYVMPAASPDASHAAWYSDTYAPAGGTITRASLHMGRRDGEPFFHCHGMWEVPGGAPGEGLRMGHLLPFEAELAEPTEVAALALSGAILDVADDAETNFRLFAPAARAPLAAADVGRPAVLATVRPNTDICEEIEAICAAQGIAAADIVGLGSLIGADYADGSHVASYATEVMIRQGRVRTGTPGATGPRAELDIALVGMDGGISQGVLVHGANPVCVTFELLILA